MNPYTVSDKKLHTLSKNAFLLLKDIIGIPSYSFEETKRADYICKYLYNNNIEVKRLNNNIICTCTGFNKKRPVLMLNSHIDTVHESDKYSFDPFSPFEKDDAIFGLGSNDAGASVVSLIQTFLFFNECAVKAQSQCSDNPNIVLALSAEEERSGKDGMDAIIEYFKNGAGYFPENAIIGEPTGMKAAIGERGLLVLDGIAEGVSGHAANDNGINAIYIAMDDIEKLRNYKFTKKSEIMGETKLSVTQINAGTAHNVVPGECSFVVDIRPTNCYTNTEIYNLLKNEIKSKITPRNLMNKSSVTPSDSTLIKCAKKLQIECYISPTTSDWMRFPKAAIKMGPGESSRSHIADEFVYKSEIKNGIRTYINFIRQIYDI